MGALTVAPTAKWLAGAAREIMELPGGAGDAVITDHGQAALDLQFGPAVGMMKTSKDQSAART